MTSNEGMLANIPAEHVIEAYVTIVTKGLAEAQCKWLVNLNMSKLPHHSGGNLS